MRKTRNYLSRGVAADEFVEDLLGFGWQFCGGFGVSVILAGKVERNVLLAELGHQEGSEGTQSIWGKRGNVITHVCVAVIKASGSPPGHENDCAWCFFARGGGIECNCGRLHLLDRSFSKDFFHLRHSSRVGLKKQTKSISLGSELLASTQSQYTKCKSGAATRQILTCSGWFCSPIDSSLVSAKCCRVLLSAPWPCEMRKTKEVKLNRLITAAKQQHTETESLHPEQLYSRVA